MSAAGAYIKPYLRVHRVSGAGHADRARSGRLYPWPERPGAPCHVKEEGLRYGKGAAELCIRKRGGGR